MNLQQALRRPEFNGMTSAQMLSHGNESVVIAVSDELWSYSGVSIQFGDAAAEGLYQAIQGAGLVGGAEVYLTRGIQLSLDLVQDKLSMIAQASQALAPVCNALKEIGVTHGTRWQLWGIAQPVLQDIDAARNANGIEDARAALKSRVGTLWNEVINPLLEADGTTWDDFQSAVAGA